MDPSASDQYTAPEGDLGEDLDFELDDEDFDDENGDLLRILGIAGGVAALVGGAIILMGRRQKTPVERLTSEVRHSARDLRKAAAQVDLGALLQEARDAANARIRDANLPDLARAARHSGRDLVRSAGQAVRGVDLEQVVQDAGRRMATIEHEGRRGAKRAQKEARKALRDLDLGALPADVGSQLSDLWDGVTKRAKDVGWDEALQEASKEVRRLNKQVRRSTRNVDLSGLADLLDTVRSQVGDATQRVQKDVLPSVQDTLQDEVLPEARKRARQAGEALSAVAQEARKRGGQLADDYGPQIKKGAGKTAEGAKGIRDQFADVLRVVALEVVDRVMRDVLPGAKKGGERVASTMRDDTLPWLRHRAGEVRDRMKDDVGPRVLDAASAAPGQVRDAVVGQAAPAIADLLSTAVDTLGGAMSRARPKIGDAVDAGRGKAGDALRSGSSGVGGALSSVGRKAGDAVGATVDTTKYVTGETSRILFWLSMLSGMLLMVFVPDAEKQKEIWNNLQEFLGELRNMWGDFAEEEVPPQEYTGDAGV
ncbi:MAG TPA: hypothetical protein VKY74_06685 [Chloroflexia bacterium]|nr:hypothetical protein [Chloroflexia bacterium]